jgi:hypothetical protein
MNHLPESWIELRVEGNVVYVVYLVNWGSGWELVSKRKICAVKPSTTRGFKWDAIF